MQGLLAESWDQPDLQTIIFHIRKGVHWQDIPPVNGRELTAYDIEYSYHRRFGLGSGFTTVSPYCTSTAYAPLKSVTATDKYTVVFKWKQPSLDMFFALMDVFALNHIEPREAIEKWGGLDDWRHAVGTGPWTITSPAVP
jgi:peptide/nickel transport system substrate-binding protein